MLAAESLPFQRVLQRCHFPAGEQIEELFDLFLAELFPDDLHVDDVAQADACRTKIACQFDFGGLQLSG